MDMYIDVDNVMLKKEERRTFNLKIFRLTTNLSYVQLSILDKALDVYSKSKGTKKGNAKKAIMLKQKLINNTVLKRNDCEKKKGKDNGNIKRK